MFCKPVSKIVLDLFLKCFAVFRELPLSRYLTVFRSNFVTNGWLKVVCANTPVKEAEAVAHCACLAHVVSVQPPKVLFGVHLC